VTYIIERFWIDDLPQDNYYAEYWSASRDSSSIFASFQTAIREARVEYPWLAKARDD